jgi:two-component system cell cycle sensor histidine kinase/response regulator CckA
MPGIDGVELWERLRKLRPGIKVLFLSGWASDAVVRHRILEGEVPFVQKPFTAETLGRKVFELMKR